MKRVLTGLLFLFAVVANAQYTLTTSNTVKMANATRPWVDMADPTCFGNGQIFKSLFFCDGGDLPQLYNQNSWTVSTGTSGGTPTTTSIPTAATGGNGTTTSYSVTGGVVTLTGSYTGLFATQFVQFNGFTSATFLNKGSAFLTSASATTLVFNWGGAPNTSSTPDTGGVYLGYPPNYFLGATYSMKNSATGATYGTGTISASTATTLAHGPVFTLSTPLSSVPVSNDVLIVQLRIPSQLMTPFQLYGRLGANTTSACAGMTFNAVDKDPGSTNKTQSLSLPPGCTLTLFADQGQRNATNPNPALAAQQVSNINLNGSYAQSLRVKCAAASGTGTLTYGVVRGSTTYLGSHPVVSSCTNTTGAGWSQPSNIFVATETGGQSGNIAYSLACSASSAGPCLLQDIDVVEGSTLPGNTSGVRDDVIRTLMGQTGVLTGLKPGGIRWMAPPQWGSYQAQQWQPDNNRAWTNVSNFIPFSMEAVMGYDTMLSVCDVVGVSCYISVGMFNGPSDWAALITTLSTNAHYINIKAAGNQVYLANGNEAFNSAAGGSLFEGDGVLYGSWFAPNFVAARAASGFDATHMKLVANSWFAPGQSDGTFGWLGQMLRTAFAAGGANALPDDVEIAPYNFSHLDNCSTAGTPCLTSGLSPTGEPMTGLFSQIPSFDITLPRPSGEGSVIASVQAPAAIGSQYAGIKTMVYEMNSGLISGSAASIDQIDSVAAGVGEALALGEHWEMMQFNSGVSGPLGTFLLTEGFNGFTCSGTGCPSGLVSPVWGIMRTMPCGPGQLNTCLPQFRPQGVIMQQVSRAIGTNSNLMASTLTCSGTCSYNYPGGQPSGGTNTIPANTAVSFVNCYQRNLGSNVTIDCYNVDTANSHTVTIAGPQAPTSTVNQAVFPATGSVISHNEASYIATLGTPAVVTLPAVTSTSGTAYTIAPGKLLSLTFAFGGTPTAGAPTFTPPAGTYSSAQLVALSNPSSAPLVCFNTTGASILIAGASSCPAGSTHYTGVISVSTNQTITAVAGGIGFLDSSTVSAAYIISPILTAPSFAPPAGTYGSAQTVAVTFPAGSVACVGINTTPTAPTAGTCGAGGTIYTGPISVAVSETLNAIATQAGHTNSSVATAAYVIGMPMATTPVFSPVGGTYSAFQTVTVSDSTPSSSIFCTIDGTTPTPSSPPYTGPFSVTTTETIKCMATAPGFSNSGVGSSTYTLVAATPAFSPAPGAFPSSPTVTITTDTPAASIYFTVDGSTPTPSSTHYTGPIFIGMSPVTLKAIAVATGFSNSGVQSGTYTIQPNACVLSGTSKNFGSYIGPCPF